MKFTIEVDTSILPPNAREVADSHVGKFRAALRAVKPNHSFVWPTSENSQSYLRKKFGLKFTMQKQNGGGYRVWRLK